MNIKVKKKLDDLVIGMMNFSNENSEMCYRFLYEGTKGLYEEGNITKEEVMPYVVVLNKYELSKESFIINDTIR